jgi:hypothetical protein
MQTNVILQPDAVPVVKSSLEMKRKALEFNLRQYRERLAAFEQTHQMSSRQFADSFRAGKLGDDAMWFEWECVLDAIKETESQLRFGEEGNDVKCY